MFFKLKSVSALTNYAIDLYENGKYQKAKKICQKIIKMDSQNYTTFINLGNICFIEKKYNEAIAAYQKADSIKKDYYPTKINLANTFLEMQNYNKAIEMAEEALKLDSSSMMAYNILGCSYLELEKFSEAISNLLQAEKLDSKDAWIHNYLSQAYQKNNDFIKALEQGWLAIKYGGNEDAHHINFGYLLYEVAMENKQAAEQYSDLWLKNFPFNKIALHMGNAIKNSAHITTTNQEYLKNIFNVFAENFDEVLADLEYKTPEQIGACLAQIYGDKKRCRLKILDAGCGTGLCGKYLKKYAGFLSLYGVDLSEEMLKKAKEKNIYDKLSCEDLNAYLSKHKKAFDLIVSADVFTYFGDLDSLFENLRFSVRKNGRIVFSFTENIYNENNYFLHMSGRFLHHIHYIENLLKKNDFLLEKAEKTMLRKEGGKEVWGYIISAVGK